VKPTRLGLFAFFFVLLGSYAASQGLIVEVEKSSGGTEKLCFMPGKFKNVDSEGKITIVRLDQETLYQIDPENRSYTAMTFADMKKMSDAGKSVMDAMMKKKMESLPPEKRKAYEDRMAAYQKGTSAETKYDVTNTGESKIISGYACTKYLVKRNGENYETIWATGAIGDVEVARKDMEQLMEKMSSAMKTRSTPLVWFKQIPGFPVKTERSGNTSTVSHVEKRTVSDSEFEVPAGYAREQHKGLENLGQ
jgi:hypothetical protein